MLRILVYSSGLRRRQEKHLLAVTSSNYYLPCFNKGIAQIL